jgi:hypothetical protein
MAVSPRTRVEVAPAAATTTTAGSRVARPQGAASTNRPKAALEVRPGERALAGVPRAAEQEKAPAAGSGGAFGGAGDGGGAGGNQGGAGPGTIVGAEAWRGRWNGTVTYYKTTVLPSDGPSSPPTVVMREEQLAMAIRIDELEYDPRSGWATVRGRLAAGECLISADLDGRTFLGDELSSVKAPVVSFEAAGTNAAGQFVAVRMSGERLGNTISGTLNFVSVDDLGPPCSMQDLKFQLTRGAAAPPRDAPFPAGDGMGPLHRRGERPRGAAAPQRC